MTDDLHPNIAKLMKKYARDLGQITPSDSLDARIDQLVAVPPGNLSRPPTVRRWDRPFAWAAAASLAVLAISAGILIGMRLERSSNVAAVNSLAREAAQQVAWAPEDLGMWPSDSVALALRVGVPIHAEESVLAEAGLVIPDEQEDEVEKFREVLDSISPEDFRGAR